MSYRVDKLKMRWIYTFKFNFILNVRINQFPQTIGLLNKVFYTSDPNLMILAYTGDKILREQPRDWHTHTHIRELTLSHTPARPVKGNNKCNLS